jgi:ubiquinone/menaquinone biosynthesis C-methylase UbiE
MNEKYWDGVAATYDVQVFNTLANDRNRAIARSINRLASSSASVADFGCGVGKYVRLLSSKFRKVVAIDHSGKLLDIARHVCGDLKNVSYVKADLTDPRVKLPAVDAAISINVLLTSDTARRIELLRTIFRTLRTGGGLVLVVPALESTLYSISKLNEWNRRSRTRRRGVSGDAIAGCANSRRALTSGVIYLDDQATKHFVREEIESLVRSTGFDIESTAKVEYSWDYEFDRPPRWMKEPYPWDWLLFCRKNRRARR